MQHNLYAGTSCPLGQCTDRRRKSTLHCCGDAALGMLGKTVRRQVLMSFDTTVLMVILDPRTRSACNTMPDLLYKSVINWFASTLILPFPKVWHGVTPLLCTCNNITDLNTLLGQKYINIHLLLTKLGSFIYCKLDQIVLNRCKMAFVKRAFHWWGAICSWKHKNG